MTGNINSIETLGLLDGPGVRFVVFMQGCPLRCLFCHNPETWDNEPHLSMTPSELITRITKYHSYFGEDGGVTFSGGEPLNQPEFLLEALKLCKQFGFHTCLDTAGVGRGNYEEILKYTDLVLYDIKALNAEDYQDMTGQKIDESLLFLNLCQKLNKKMWLRQVIVPGINDNKDYILKLKDFIKPLKNIEKIELLAYHTLGNSKYDKLNLPYRLKDTKAMDKKTLDELSKLLMD